MEQMNDGWNLTCINAEGSFKVTYIQTSVSMEKMREDIIVKSFKKCSISNALDGREDHLIYKEDNLDHEEEEEEEESSDDDFQGF